MCVSLRSLFYGAGKSYCEEWIQINSPARLFGNEWVMRTSTNLPRSSGEPAKLTILFWVRAAHEFIEALLALAVDKNLEVSSNQFRVALNLDFALKLLQHRQIAALFLLRNRVAKSKSLGARAR